MQTNTSGQTLERAAEETAVTIKLGLDVHATQVTVCRQWDGRLPQPAQQLGAAQVLKLVEEHVARGHRVYTCYEAGPCGYGLHRALAERGATNYVVAPQRWDERGRRVKTDRRDARELCQRLDRYVRGNTEVFTVVRVPSEQQERRRLLCRQRATLLKERQRCELRGHGLMLVHGFDVAGGWWETEAWRELGPQLPEWLREHLERWQQYAVRLEQQVAELNTILETEIGDWSRFHNRRQPGSYSGLCPSEHSSNQRRRQGSVTKHGNPRIRHLLVEAAWRMLEWQPEYPPIKKARALKGRQRKRAIVAAARQLAVDLWRLRTGRCSAEQLKLVMVEL
jgi:transposase